MSKHLEMRNVRVLITGVCGFVGSVLATSLQAHRADVDIIGIDNLSRPGSELNRGILQEQGVRFVHGDIRLGSDLDDLPPADLVIDAAANPSVLAGLSGASGARQLVEHNLLGTINLLEYCKRHHSAFIMLSTSRVYSINALAALTMQTAGNRFLPVLDHPFPEGLSENGIGETFPTTAPISLYGATKLASEALALEYGSMFSFPVWINRCGVLAGPGQFGRADQGIFSFWIHSWQQRRPLKFLGFGGTGNQVRDCLDPADLTSLILMQSDEAGDSKPRVLNVGGGVGSSMSLKELSVWCEQRFGKHNVLSDGTARPYDLPWVVLDSSLAASVWGWSPTIRRDDILESIAVHAETHVNWMQTSRRC